MGGSVRGRIHFGHDRRISQCHRPTRSQVDVAPETHVLVGWRRVPIYESDGQTRVSGSPDLRRDYVGSWLHGGGYVELIGTPRARDLIRVRDLPSVQPDIPAIVMPRKFSHTVFPAKSLGNVN